MVADDRDRTDGSDRWREYSSLGVQYMFYLELVVRALGAYFVIVGGLLTLVLANAHETPLVLTALAIPILMSLLLAFASLRAVPKTCELEVAMNMSSGPASSQACRKTISLASEEAVQSWRKGDKSVPADAALV
jgi:hypothetical protein